MIQADQVKPDGHLFLLNNGAGHVPVFIIPGTGGMAGSYNELANSFRETAPVYCIQSVGTLEGEMPLHTVLEVATISTKWIELLQPEGHYRLMGHSFGAHVAFEVVRQLLAKGKAVDFIAVLDEYAGLKSDVPPGVDVSVPAMKLAADYLRDFNIIPDPYPDWFLDLAPEIAATPLKEMAAFIAGKLKEKLPEKNEDIDFVIRLINLRIYNAHMSYTPEEKIDTTLIVFKAEETFWEDSAGALGWEDFATNVVVVDMPGNHGMNDVNSATVADYLIENYLKKLPQQTQTGLDYA